jgi:hypothetical protein
MSALRLTAIIVLATIAQTWSSVPTYERPKTYCALALPPSQVISTPRLEVVYCHSISSGQCHVAIGWIVVTEPVRCE